MLDVHADATAKTEDGAAIINFAACSRHAVLVSIILAAGGDLEATYKRRMDEPAPHTDS